MWKWQDNNDDNKRLPKVIWEQAMSPPLVDPCTTPNRSSTVHTLLHSYATNSPLVTTRRPTSAPKSNYLLISGLIQPTISNRIHTRSAVLPQCIEQTHTHTHTHRPTDGWRECSITISCYRSTQSDAQRNNNNNNNNNHFMALIQVILC